MSDISAPSVGIYTLGCKVNQYESQAIAEAFAKEGFSVLPPDQFCQVYVINTCTVTAESDRKARQFIRRAIRKNPAAYILVTGCLSQTAPETISSIPGVDYICGNRNKLSVVAAAKALLAQGTKRPLPLEAVESLDHATFESMTIHHFDRTRAYVKIEDGCESHCTYCIIPSARGAIRSKSPEEVENEVRTLTAGGCREIVLTGIETASYGKDLTNTSLADLLCRIDRIPNIGRVRLGSLDPSLLRPAFVEKIASLHALCPHFHLSMQSGSDSVLARMKRKYNTRMAMEGMERLRAAMPRVQFTTDIIVGFPGETEEEFAETMDFVRRAGFLMIHVFPYSRRKGTPAAVMPGQIDEQIKHERAGCLIRAAAEIRQRVLEELIRTENQQNVLFETFEKGLAIGHTDTFVEVAVESSCSLHAQTLPVRLLSAEDGRCRGELLLP